MYKKASENYLIKTLCAPGISTLTMSHFRTYLTLNFVPYIGKDHMGFDQYCRKVHLSTTLSYDAAVYFLGIVTGILSGKEPQKQIGFTVPCKNHTTLTFEYKPDENNQMVAYIIINKNNLTIPFRFGIRLVNEKVDGRMVTKVIQVGLEAFAAVLNEYIDRINAIYDSYR